MFNMSITKKRRERKKRKKTLWHKKLSSVRRKIRSTCKTKQKVKTQNASQVKWYDHLIAFSTLAYIRTINSLIVYTFMDTTRSFSHAFNLKFANSLRSITITSVAYGVSMRDELGSFDNSEIVIIAEKMKCQTKLWKVFSLEIKLKRGSDRL